MTEVEGALELSVDGVPARIWAAGNWLRLDVDRPRGFFRGFRLRRIRGVARMLAREGLTLELCSGGERILVLGREARSAFARRALRTPFVGFGSARSLRRLFRR